MKIPIPADWDGQSWDCFQVQWPSSPAYRMILVGFLSQMMRGPFWDVQSGWIPDAQAVGVQVFDRNYPLVDCAGEPVPCPECALGCQNGPSGAFDDEGEYEMPCLDISGLIKIENGHLYVKDSCCGWVDLGSIAGLNEGVPDDPLNPTGDPNFVYSACGKAKAIVDAVYTTVQAGYSSLNEPAPWQVLPYIESAVGYNLDNNQLFGMLAEITAGLVLGIEQSDVNDPIERQKILCRVAREFVADAEGVPTSEKFEAIKACFKAEMWPFSLWWGMYEYAINAIGRNDMNTIAKLGAANTAAQCDCPDETPELFYGLGLSKAWRYVWDFRQSLGAWVQDGETQWTSGIGLWGLRSATQNRNPVAAHIELDQLNNGSTLEIVSIAFTLLGDENLDNDYCHAGTEDVTAIDYALISNLVGDDPTQAGTFTITASLSDPLDAVEHQFTAQLTAYHPGDREPQTAARSLKIIGLMYAGSGPGPLSTPPV